MRHTHEKIWWKFNYNLGAIAGNGLIILLQIEGTLNALKYTHILDKFLREAFTEYNQDLDYFQEVNDPKHGGPNGAKTTKDWFENNPDIIRIEWPPNSPDLNPIENV